MHLQSFKNRTLALQALDASRLRDLVDNVRLAVSDRRSRDTLIQALADARRVDFRAVLAHATRDELKAMCRALGLPDDGKEKVAIIDRLLGDEADKLGGPAGELPTEGADAARSRLPWRDQVIDLLKRDELVEIIDELHLDVGDRRVLRNLKDAVAATREPVADLLEWLTRARLKELCRILGLDDGGREKAPIIERLAAPDRAAPEEDDHEIESDEARTQFKPDVLAELLAPYLTLDETNQLWPGRGTLAIAGSTIPVDIYARIVGPTGRDPLERRFQNPGTGVPITPQKGRPCLLLGIWVEKGPARAVLVAFDAYRRRGRTTRTSHFMSLSLLEKAADTGFVSHATASGETIYAFRPDSIGRYMDAFAEGSTWREVDPGLRSPAKAPGEAPALPRRSMTPAHTGMSVEIRPRAGMFAAFARLNYKPWFALAELVDNAVQSFLKHRRELAAAGSPGPLIVDVSLDGDELAVTDRAAGIALQDFPRAFSPAMPPSDPSGLSEFGLGMKAAASWFAREWSVRTSALGEPTERTVTFDIHRITTEGIDHLPIEAREARPEDHYTVVTMRKLRVRPRGTTLAKIKEHLGSIYRLLIADGTVRIRFTASGKTEELAYEQPKLLVAPFYATPSAPPVRWHREIDVKIDERSVRGWAGLMEVGKHSRAGFSVFRRGRLIEGSVGEAYRHRAIFGAHNSFASQRLVGELYVEGFDVTHTKDGIQWGDDEDGLAYQIRLQLDDPLPMLEQAGGYRARKTASTLPSSFGSEAVAATASSVNGVAIEATPPWTTPPDDVEPSGPESGASTTQHQRFEMRVDGDQTWEVHLELVRDRAADWLFSGIAQEDGREFLQIRVNLDHPFSEEHLNDNERALDPVLRLAIAIALGERQARNQGVRGCGAVKSNANELLRTGLSSPMMPNEEKG